MAGLTRRIVTLPCVAAVLAGLTIAACGSGSARLTGKQTVAEPGGAVPALAIPRLKAIADQLAKENGHAVPSWVSAVVTSQQKALASINGGSGPGGQTVVYLVTMKGHFTWGGSAPVPGHVPTGRYLSLVVPAKTFEVRDVGLSPDPPPISPSSLGPVTWLKR
jgi:hypothetical protein